MREVDQAAIRAEGLHKYFDDLHVLKGLDLTIAPDERFILMGLSGSGKSVFLKHLIALHRPDAGTVRIDGEDVFAMDGDQLRRYLCRVGMVFQNSALFDSMSTGDNIAFPMREHTNRSEAEIRDHVEWLLGRVGMDQSYHKNPAELSGGMRKRAGIARGLALRPDFVYFDEPTSGLDVVTGAVIADLILETHADFGYTCVVITHNWEIARKLGDRVALLWKGRIHAMGTPDELQASDDDLVQRFLRADPSVLMEN